MRRRAALRFLSFCLAVGGAPTVCAPAQSNPPQNAALKKKPCDFVTKSDAETILGKAVVARESNAFECSFREAGFTSKAPLNHQVDFSIWYSASPDPNDYAVRQKNIADYPTPSQVVTSVPGFGDAATWVWVPGWGGTLYAFNGGTIQVEVVISGVPESAALRSAKALAAKALGGSAGTGYAYVTPKKYNAAVASTAAATAAAESAAAAKARVKQSAARQALANEPEVRQANGTSDNYQGTANLPNGDERKPSQSGMALQGFFTVSRIQASLDRLEIRLDDEARACKFCASKQDELSELVSERVELQETVAHISTQTGTAGQDLLALSSAPTRWQDPHIALSEATVYLREHCQRFKDMPEEFCQAKDGDLKLAGAHEKTWARCFRANNWVEESSKRIAYEDCLKASDPFTKLCETGREASPPERTCPPIRVGSADVDHLLYYSDRWMKTPEPSKPAAVAPLQAGDVRKRLQRYSQRVYDANFKLTGNLNLNQAQPRAGYTVPPDIQRALNHMKAQQSAAQLALNGGNLVQAEKDLADGEATTATVEKFLRNK